MNATTGTIRHRIGKQLSCYGDDPAKPPSVDTVESVAVVYRRSCSSSVWELSHMGTRLTIMIRWRDQSSDCRLKPGDPHERFRTSDSPLRGGSWWLLPAILVVDAAQVPEVPAEHRAAAPSNWFAATAKTIAIAGRCDALLVLARTSCRRGSGGNVAIPGDSTRPEMAVRTSGDFW